ncbi:MAG: DUF1700 domain-containing protein [Clostridiales bacterium]|nr:DUF1700 domain-containing protein [Clostridiales bacterium]
MNKEQFLAAIQEGMSGLNQRDLEPTIDYYREMIDDRIEEGLTEEQAIQALGPVSDIIAQILTDTSLAQLIKSTYPVKRGMRPWEITLLVIGSPIWGSLLLGAAALLFGIYILIWSFVLLLYAADLVFACASLGVINSIFLLCTGQPIQALFFFGAGLIGIGIAIPFFFGCNKVARGVIKLSKKFVIRLKRWILKKGGAK